MFETIGFLELNSIAKGVEAADAILKAAEVELIFAKPVCNKNGAKSRRVTILTSFKVKDNVFLTFS